MLPILRLSAVQRLLPRRLRLLLIASKDAARHSPLLRHFAGRIRLTRARLSKDPVSRAIHLARALSSGDSPSFSDTCTRALHRQPGFEGSFDLWKKAVLHSPRYRQRLSESPQIDRSILLKAPQSPNEKGLLLLTFEYNWVRLLTGLSDSAWLRFISRYDLVLSTSWSPTDYASLALVLSRTQDTVFVQSCNYGEIARIEAFHPRLRCLPTLPCDWIFPDHYEPLPHQDRDIDLIMVANWGEFKRHWELFQALASLPPELKVVLVGQPEPGRDKSAILQLARDFGAPQILEIHESLSIEAVSRLQCRAKASVIMTRREGCCVAAVESLFAGCSVGMRSDAHVGPVAYLNPETGVRLRPKHLAEDLMALIQQSSGRSPRVWASHAISALVTWQRVNDFFAHHASGRSQPWTEGIGLPKWRPHPTFARAEERASMAPFYRELHQLAPNVFPSDLADTSWR